MGVSNVLPSLALTALTVAVHITPAVRALEADFYARQWGIEGTEEEIEYEAACANGVHQSPINLDPNFMELEQLPKKLRTLFNFPAVKDAYISNTGHNLQMNWDTDSAFDMTAETFPRIPAGGSGIRDVLEDPSVEVDRKVKVIPAQMHWHVTSEHSWDGMLGAAEAHIVSYVAEGEAPDWGCDVIWSDDDATAAETTRYLQNCIAVFGIIFRMTEKPAESDDFFFAMEAAANIYVDEDGGTDFDVSPFDLSSVLPKDLSYYTYVGSLTTPPCSEGLRWHVFNEHVPMSVEAFTRLELHTARTSAGPGEEQQNYRHNERDIQPLGDRTLYFSDSGDAEVPGSVGNMCSAHGGKHSGHHKDGGYGGYGME